MLKFIEEVFEQSLHNFTLQFGRQPLVEIKVLAQYVETVKNLVV